MKIFLSRWLTITFLNFLLVAFLGFILRYKIAFYLPFVEQKNLLHSHSHFAFSGWISQTLMVLMVYYLSQQLGEGAEKKYRWILIANLLSAYGMLVSFIIFGYASVSIFFSTLSLFISFAFALIFWRDLNKVSNYPVSTLWFKAALFFSVISSIGPFSLAYMMIEKITDPNWYLASVYFFLHFQYNGWFFFSGMGLLASKLEMIPAARKSLYYSFILFCAACIPAYFLSVLWLPASESIYYLLILAVIAQLLGWGFILRIIMRHKALIGTQFSRHGKILLILAAVAFTIKLLLQTGSIHPGLSQLSYGFRPIIIGYLHLVLLGVTSIFIIGYILSLDLLAISRKFIVGVYIFVAGVIINELLLMVQGVAALSYTIVPYINLMLLAAALILVSGIFLMFTAFLSYNRPVGASQ